MSNLNRFALLNSSDDEDAAPAPAQVKATPTPAPASSSKKNKSKNNRRGRDGSNSNAKNERGRGRGNRSGNRGGRREGQRSGGDRGGRRGFDGKESRRRDRRRQEERSDRGDGASRRTRQPRNGERSHRHGRDPKKQGHGGIGTLAEEAAAGEAEVRGDKVVAEGEEQVPAPAPEPEKRGITMQEYQAKILAEKRKGLQPQKAVRKVESTEGVQGATKLNRDRDGVVKTYGSKKNGGTGSRKIKKNFVNADKFFSTKAREDDRGNRRSRSSPERNQNAPLDIHNDNDFPSL